MSLSAEHLFRLQNPKDQVKQVWAGLEEKYKKDYEMLCANGEEVLDRLNLGDFKLRKIYWVDLDWKFKGEQGESESICGILLKTKKPGFGGSDWRSKKKWVLIERQGKDGFKVDLDHGGFEDKCYSIGDERLLELESKRETDGVIGSYIFKGEQGFGKAGVKCELTDLSSTNFIRTGRLGNSISYEEAGNMIEKMNLDMPKHVINLASEMMNDYKDLSDRRRNENNVASREEF